MGFLDFFAGALQGAGRTLPQVLEAKQRRAAEAARAQQTREFQRELQGERLEAANERQQQEFDFRFQKQQQENIQELMRMLLAKNLSGDEEQKLSRAVLGVSGFGDLMEEMRSIEQAAAANPALKDDEDRLKRLAIRRFIARRKNAQASLATASRGSDAFKDYFSRYQDLNKRLERKISEAGQDPKAAREARERYLDDLGELQSEFLQVPQQGGEQEPQAGVLDLSGLTGARTPSAGGDADDVSLLEERLLETFVRPTDPELATIQDRSSDLGLSADQINVVIPALRRFKQSTDVPSLLQAPSEKRSQAIRAAQESTGGKNLQFMPSQQAFVPLPSKDEVLEQLRLRFSGVMENVGRDEVFDELSNLWEFFGDPEEGPSRLDKAYTKLLAEAGDGEAFLDLGPGMPNREIMALLFARVAAFEAKSEAKSRREALRRAREISSSFSEGVPFLR